MLNAEQIARVCHEANRAYCEILDDFSQPPWWEAPDWQKESAIAGVQAYLDDPDITPEQSHENWMALKEEADWVYGEVKDPDIQTHPCMVSYSDLPSEQRVKDALFLGIVRVLSSAGGNEGDSATTVADTSSMSSSNQ